MKINNKTQRWSRSVFLVLPILLVGLLLCAGCSNDPVAPQDEIPGLSAQDVATQAGFMAAAVTQIGPVVIEFSDKAGDNPYEHVMLSDFVTGSIFLNYTSGQDATPSFPADADHVDAYTADGAPLAVVIAAGGLTGTAQIAFDVAAELDRTGSPHTAVINGDGTFTSGANGSTFVFNDLAVVDGGEYPVGGSVSFINEPNTATITYNGTEFAVMELSNGDSYIVDLTTGMAEENNGG